MSIDWKCPDCKRTTRLASEMIPVLRWHPLLGRYLPGYACSQCAPEHIGVTMESKPVSPGAPV